MPQKSDFLENHPNQVSIKLVIRPPNLTGNLLQLPNLLGITLTYNLPRVNLNHSQSTLLQILSLANAFG